MVKREIGRGGVAVNPIGLGCMGMSAFYGAPMRESDAVSLTHEAIDLGVDHFDTAELYLDNETLMGKALKGKRDKVFLATKFGPVIDWATGRRMGVDGSEANCRRAIENSLRALQTDYIDLYYLHRPDRSRPIEETVGAMKRLVEEGKIRSIGLSEASAENIRRGHAVHPIAAVQTEYSIFSRVVETHVLPTLSELGVTLVAYSPLGRGMLTGRYKTDQTFGAGDFRGAQPRFSGAALEANLALVAEIERVASAHNATTAQVALAWVLARAPNVVTIPGTTKLANLKNNIGANDVRLSSADMAALNALAEKVVGERYDESGMKMLDTDAAH